jgi:hypothetical protein
MFRFRVKVEGLLEVLFSTNIGMLRQLSDGLGLIVRGHAILDQILEESIGAAVQIPTVPSTACEPVHSRNRSVLVTMPRNAVAPRIRGCGLS